MTYTPDACIYIPTAPPPTHTHIDLFRTLYEATMKNIRNKEANGFKVYTGVVRHMQAASVKCPPNHSDLIELYNGGRAVYHRFHAFIAEAARASDTANTYKMHGTHQPCMKGIYRVLEKGVFKYNDDHEGELDFSQVRDLVRGGIIDSTMEGLAKVAKHLLGSANVQICRVKDRFNEPSAAGWTDLMVNFYFNDDPNKHVCEVQLIHFKMLSQRTTQEGHNAYNIFRVRGYCYAALPIVLPSASVDHLSDHCTSP